MPKDTKSNIKKKSIGGKKYEIGAGGSRTSATSGSGSRSSSGAKITSVVTKQGVKSIKSDIKALQKVKSKINKPSKTKPKTSTQKTIEKSPWKSRELRKMETKFEGRKLARSWRRVGRREMATYRRLGYFPKSVEPPF